MRQDVDGKIVKVEFDSLCEFYDYICNTPLNETFRWETKQSDLHGSRAKWWSKTESFAEATELFKRGWSEMSERLVQRLKVEESKMEPVMVSKNTIGVQGYHPIVPLYLMGIPTNMVRKEMKPVSRKVITLNKAITYNAKVSPDTIIDESIKALMLVKKMEAQNYRCNLNLVMSNYTFSRTFIVKIRIKSANEKLNISKLSFPLVHPSMLRRLLLRFFEVHPLVTRDFTRGYGMATPDSIVRSFTHGEYYLPPIIRKDVKKVRNLDDLEKLDQI